MLKEFNMKMAKSLDQKEEPGTFHRGFFASFDLVYSRLPERPRPLEAGAEARGLQSYVLRFAHTFSGEMNGNG